MWEPGEVYKKFWLEYTKGGNHLEDRHRCKDNIKIDDKEVLESVGLYLLIGG
jgi:hypothetical protein